jgi:hypothetical protein
MQAGNITERREEDILHDRVDHFAECGANHHRNRQIDHVPFERELFEFLPELRHVAPR